MKSSVLFLLTTLAGVPLASGVTIGVKFLDSNDVSFGAATAGAPAYAQPNWNHVQTDWSGSAQNDALFAAGLVDSTGSSTVGGLQNISYPTGHVDPLHYDSANTWRSGAGNGDANATLMNGYLDDGGNDQPYVNLSLANGFFSTYTVVLYVNGDGQNGAVGRYWLESWADSLTPGTVITDFVGISSNSYTGTFVSAGTFSQTGSPLNADVASGNYIVFENVTARNLRIRSSGNGDPEDFGRGPLNGFQIIDTTVPEPSGALVLGLSCAAFVLRRRK